MYHNRNGEVIANNEEYQGNEELCVIEEGDIEQIYDCVQTTDMVDCSERNDLEILDGILSLGNDLYVQYKFKITVIFWKMRYIDIKYGVYFQTCFKFQYFYRQ